MREILSLMQDNKKSKVESKFESDFDDENGASQLMSDRIVEDDDSDVTDDEVSSNVFKDVEATSDVNEVKSAKENAKKDVSNDDTLARELKSFMKSRR